MDTLHHVDPEVGVLVERLVELVEEGPLALRVADEGLEEGDDGRPRLELG